MSKVCRCTVPPCSLDAVDSTAAGALGMQASPAPADAVASAASVPPPAPRPPRPVAYMALNPAFKKRGRAWNIPPTAQRTFLGEVHQERNLRGCWTPHNSAMAVVRCVPVFQETLLLRAQSACQTCASRASPLICLPNARIAGLPPNINK